MSQKNETTILVLAVLITAGLVGIGFWLLAPKSGVDTSNSSNNQSPQSTGETFAQVQGVPSGLFNYGGSSTWASIRKEVDLDIQTVWPKYQLRYTNPRKGAPTSEIGIRMLLENQLDFAQSSIPIPDKYYQQAQQRGIGLKEIPVAIDALAVVVHPSLNIPGLTVDQVDKIYEGKITNWNQIGGPNLKIKPYSKTEQKPGSHVQFASTTTEALRGVAINPAGIFYASAPLLVTQCNVKPLPLGRNANELVAPYKEPLVPINQCPNKRNELNVAAFKSGQYPNTRRLFVIIKQDGHSAQKAGEAYANLMLTAQGQAALAKAGFVSIR
jgi:phosphate transport system substrate-binding protein